MKTYAENLIEKIAGKTVAVIGAGGLGGYVIGELMRLPLGELVIVDGDVFSVSNLDRQLFSSTATLGKNKAEVAKLEVEKVGFIENVTAFTAFFNIQNGEELLKSADIAIDCTDNLYARLELETVCDRLAIPLVHGAINGAVGQVAVIMPASHGLTKLYGGKLPRKTQKTLPYVPAATASLQVSEAVKVLAGEPTLIGEMLIADFSTLEFIKVKI